MGFRFRKSVRILPGIRLNFSKSGMSTSIGRPGASVNLSSKGTRHTVGIPGSGLSYSAFTPAVANREPNDVDQGAAGSGCGWLLLGALSLLAVTMCSYSPQNKVTKGQESDPAGQIASSLMSGEIPAEPTGTVYVVSRALNGRAGPSKDSAIVTKLREGDALVVRERSGEWIKVAQGAALYWVASSHVSAQRKTNPKLGSSNRGAKHNRTRTQKHFSRPQDRFDDDCPCRGNRVCIGPRGGRYCITSGGNKRYGV